MESRNNGWITIAGAEPLAIVGMDVNLGCARNLAEFERALYSGAQGTGLPHEVPTQPTQEELARSGFANASALTREDGLLLGTAARALQDAGLQQAVLLYARGSQLAAATAQRGQAANGVIIPPLAAGQNFSRVVDLSLKGIPMAAGLQEAVQLLVTGGVEAVVIAAAVVSVDLSSLLQNESGKLNGGAFTFGFEQSVEGWTVGEGAVALVLMRPASAVAAGKRVYASIDAFAWTARDLAQPKQNLFPTLVSSETVLQSCLRALDLAGLHSAAIGYLDVLGSGFSPLDTAEITGLTRAYGAKNVDLNCALGSAGAASGYLFTASGLAGLIRTALCVYLRMLPETPAWMAPKKPELWQDTPFYVPADTRTWFLPGPASRRCGAVNSIGWDGSCAHVILSEPLSMQRPNRFLEKIPFYLFPLAGESLPELQDGLNRLKQNLQAAAEPRLAAVQCFQTYQAAGKTKYALAIVGGEREEVEREVDFALKDVPSAFEQKKSWQTPLGSSFSATPVGKDGCEAAFVYPGAFNSYLGLGRDLFFLFPQLYERAAQLTTNMGMILRERKLYPRSLEALSKEQLTGLEAQLSADPIAMITSGSLIAVLYTMILRDIFKVHPGAAFGYSLGEIAMLFGTGVWIEADAISAKLGESSLFRTRLSGPQNAVRDCWGLPQETASAPDEAFWNNYFLMAPAEKAAEAARAEWRVYLTHINTPRQVVIGGDPAGCRRVIEALKCVSLKAPFDFALHCDAMRSEYAALAELHTWPVAAWPDTRLYSAANDQPLPPDSQGIADQLARMLCSSLDFPRLVRQVYADGARVFIELGANANCSKWIDDTLKGSPYTAVAVNRRGSDDLSSIVRMLAKLVTQRVPVDLAPLYA